MAITNIAVSNFKSFKQLDLDLGRFNVVIGANASGKSNLAEIFKFLRDIEAIKLDDAIFMHGGPMSLLNRRIGAAENLRIRAVSDKPMGWRRRSRFIRFSETMYEVALRFGTEENGIEVTEDRLQHKFETGTLKENQGRLFEDEVIAKGELSSRMVNGKPDVHVEPSELRESLEKDQFFLPFLFHPEFGSENGAAKALIIQMRYPFLPPWGTWFGDIGVYNIDPHAAKRPFQIGGRAELQENGENLALILRQILDNPEKSRKLHNLLQDLLPFVAKVDVERSPEKSVLIKLRESYYPDMFLAHLLSDGTIGIAALIVALYFEEKDLIIIEEPERNIHPRLISGLVEMMKDASRNKQIIVTTHSPEVVKHAGVENLLLISRDNEGFSTISRPAEKEAVKVFLEHELGLDDLFVQDLLAVP